MSFSSSWCLSFSSVPRVHEHSPQQAAPRRCRWTFSTLPSRRDFCEQGSPTLQNVVADAARLLGDDRSVPSLGLQDDGDGLLDDDRVFLDDGHLNWNVLGDGHGNVLVHMHWVWLGHEIGRAHV